MALVFDNSMSFVYTGQTQHFIKDIGISSLYFAVKGAGGGGGGAVNSNGGGGAYVFTNYYNLNPNQTYTIAINVGQHGFPATPGIRDASGGLSIGGQMQLNTNGGNGTTEVTSTITLLSGGGGGMSSVFYMDPYGNKIIKIVAGGGGGGGNDNNSSGGDGGLTGMTGTGPNGGQGGNPDGTSGTAGLGSYAGGTNGHKYIDSTYTDGAGIILYTFQGGGGGGGGSFAGGGGGAGYGGGAGGRGDGGGGGGSFLPSGSGIINSPVTGGGGAGGRGYAAGANGQVTVYWNAYLVDIVPPLVSTYMLNPQHTCQSIYYAPIVQPVITNSIQTSITFPNGGVVSVTGEFYVIGEDHSLYAFSSDLTFRWYYSEAIFFGTPTIIGDGTLYIAARDSPNYLYAVTDTGQGVTNGEGAIKWQFPLDSTSSVSPVVDLSGIIYIGTDNGSIYAIADNGIQNGILRWRYTGGPAGQAIVGTPTFNNAYTRLCYTTATTVYVLQLSANNTVAPTTIVWQYSTQLAEQFGSPSLGLNGTLYVNTTAGNVYAFNTTGTLLWGGPTQVNDINLSSIAIGNGQIYFTSQKALNVVNSGSGALEWTYPVVPVNSTDANSIPTLDANNNVIFGGCDNNLYSVNPLSRTYNWKFSVGGPIAGMPLILNERVLFVCNDGFVYEVGNSSVPPPPLTTPVAPMYMLNAQHTGVSAYYAPTATPSVIWSAPFISGNLFVSPSISIGANGTLYIGSADGYLYARQPTTGQLLWQQRLNSSGSAIYTTPAIAGDGTIYIGSDEGYLYAVRPNGAVKWSYFANFPLESSPILDSNGTIYFAAGGSVFALGDAGYRAFQKWLRPYNTSSNITGSPALGPNGYLYFGSTDGYLYAVDSFSGSVLHYRYNTQLPIFGSPTVDAANKVLVGNGSYMDGVLYALNGQDDQPYWASPFTPPPQGGPLYNTVAVTDDTVYLSAIAYVYAIDRATGLQKWRFYKTHCYYTSPIIDASGNLLLASLDTYTGCGVVHSLSGATGEEIWSYDTGVVGRLAPPVLGSDGTIYITSTANEMYALR
jgi:outer membrane protein assembly factor BamB